MRRRMAHGCRGSAATQRIDWQPLPEPWGHRMKLDQGSAHHPGVRRSQPGHVRETRSGLWHRNAQSLIHFTAVLFPLCRLVLLAAHGTHIVYSCPASRSQHRSNLRRLTAARPPTQERREWAAGRAMGEQSTGSYPVLHARDLFATGSCLVLPSTPLEFTKSTSGAQCHYIAASTRGIYIPVTLKKLHCGRVSIRHICDMLAVAEPAGIGRSRFGPESAGDHGRCGGQISLILLVYVYHDFRPQHMLAACTSEREDTHAVQCCCGRYKSRYRYGFVSHLIEKWLSMMLIVLLAETHAEIF
jgi:hypothetical protein